VPLNTKAGPEDAAFLSAQNNNKQMTLLSVTFDCIAPDHGSTKQSIGTPDDSKGLNVHSTGSSALNCSSLLLTLSGVTTLESVASRRNRARALLVEGATEPKNKRQKEGQRC
jgi:hypothetical protein